jgi:hypothetical protein
MNADGFHPSQDDLSQYTHDFQSNLGSCDAYPFEHSNLLYDFQLPLCSDFDDLGSCDAYPFEHSNLLYDFQLPLCSDFDGDKTMVSLEQS